MLEWLVRLPHGPRKGLKTFGKGLGWVDAWPAFSPVRRLTPVLHREGVS